MLLDTRKDFEQHPYFCVSFLLVYLMNEIVKFVNGVAELLEYQLLLLSGVEMAG